MNNVQEFQNLLFLQIPTVSSNIYNEAFFVKLVNSSEAIAWRCSASRRKLFLKFLKIHRKTPKPERVFQIDFISLKPTLR